jgi:asparagine synthase (glutamine-hydrolysing)
MHEAARPWGDLGKGQDLTNSVRPDCLTAAFASEAERPLPTFEQPFADCLRNLMYRELRYTKLPRALRFRDRLSMAVGTELRPPFLDHRLVAYEFALPPEEMISSGVSKAVLRRAVARLMPDALRLASKRSVQTPQREWFRGPLQRWVRERIDTPTFWRRGWVDKKRALHAMEGFFRGEGDNSFFLWQWINLEVWAQQFLDGPAFEDAPGRGSAAAVSR